jgi:hypothetical protein
MCVCVVCVCVCVCVYELCSSIKKNEIISFAGKWMQAEIIILREISQIEKDKYHMFFLICSM